MKLYFSPFACSLAAHIALRETGLDFELVRTDFRDKKLPGGGSLFDVNAMGQVPTLVRDDGRVLTENSAVLSYLADRSPAKKLAPAPESDARYDLQRWLSFIGTEVHKKGLALIFDPTTSEAVKEFGRTSLSKPLRVLEKELSTRELLLGESFTVADAYLYWALTLLPHAGVPDDGYPSLRAYRKRITARPAVRAALEVEKAARESATTAAAD